MTTLSIERQEALGRLRSFLTLLVVLHHALIAYCRFAPPVHGISADLLWTAFPVVDRQRWGGADLIVGLNDDFFMALMFLVSGAFVWSSLMHRGAGPFLRRRLLRLGVPFLVAAALLAPLAYYPVYLAGAGQAQAGSFWQAWLALGVWPAGPAWFLWVLLAFDVFAALLYRLWPDFGQACAKQIERVSQRPLRAFLILLALSALVYLPLAAWLEPSRWLKAGPFFVQASRLGLYGLFFLIGIGLGVQQDASKDLLRKDARLARRWPAWLALTLVAYAASIAVLLVILGAIAHGGASPGLTTLGNAMFVLVCSSASFACLGLFARTAHAPRPWTRRLGANAYGIYLLHYACVTWLQFALLGAAWPGVVKALLVFVGAVVLSWTLSACLRRIPAVARIV